MSHDSSIDRLIKQRQALWEAHMLREQYLANACKKVLSIGNMEKHLHLCEVFSPPDQMVTAVNIRWRLHYSYVLGDDEYSNSKEEAARNTYCEIFIDIDGDEPEEFKTSIILDYQGPEGKLESITSWTPNELDAGRLVVPSWFTLHLNVIVLSNTNASVNHK